MLVASLATHCRMARDASASVASAASSPFTLDSQRGMEARLLVRHRIAGEVGAPPRLGARRRDRMTVPARSVMHAIGDPHGDYC